jgi:hypothetical protein
MARDGSIFSTMFSLPQGGAPAEGDTDARALLLPDECAGEFRALLWAMYALPPELMAVHLPGADLARLACIAHKAARYGFKSVEQWALDALAEHAARKPCPLLGADDAPPPAAIRAQLTRLVGLAQECAHARLLDTLVKLLTGLVPRSLPLAHLAACLADEFDLRTLRGHAYLEIMHKGTFVAAHGATPPGDLDADGRLVLTVPQHYRLLAGYHTLTGAWEALRTKPPAFEHAPNCGATWHQHGCTQSWLEFWKEKTRADNVLALGVADVIGRLRIIQKECESRAGFSSRLWCADLAFDSRPLGLGHLRAPRLQELCAKGARRPAADDRDRPARLLFDSRPQLVTRFPRPAIALPATLYHHHATRSIPCVQYIITMQRCRPCRHRPRPRTRAVRDRVRGPVPSSATACGAGVSFDAAPDACR